VSSALPLTDFLFLFALNSIMIPAMKNETLFGEPDEFEPTEVKWHTEDKYDLVRYYCVLFSSGMKHKWRGKRVYVDLYAGSGKCQIKGTSRILLGSPLIALSVEDPFDRYIFSESNPENLAHLKARVAKMHPEQDVRWVEGDCNDAARVKEICSLIPTGNLALCFVDPFECNIQHETLKAISRSTAGVDFLCLLAFQMDAKRAMAHYLKPDNRKIDDMLGNTEWRERWEQERLAGSDFARFLAIEFAHSMEGLGYRRTELEDMKVINRAGTAQPLYYLALFAKHPTAFDLWAKVLKGAPRQRPLF